MDVLDISSDEDLGLELAASCNDDDNFDWLKDVLENIDTHEDDDVLVIGEVLALPGKRRHSSYAGKLGSQNVHDDDCVVLDGDPDKPKSLNQSLGAGQVQNLDLGGESDDLVIVGEKGQVACRDYPHSRHLCVKFPFISTLHVDHCNMCHCYVCDSPAPCDEWGTGISPGDHCHAFDKDEFWKTERNKIKILKTAALPNPELVPSNAPLVNQTLEPFPYSQGHTPLSAPNSTPVQTLHHVNSPQELSMRLRLPAYMSTPNSNPRVQLPYLVHRAQLSSTQVQGPTHLSSLNSTQPVQRPHVAHEVQQSSTQVLGPTHMSDTNRCVLTSNLGLKAQPSLTQIRGSTHASTPNSTRPALLPHALVSAPQLPNIISRRTFRSPPVCGRSHRYHPHLVSRQLSTSQVDHYREIGARFLLSTPTVPLLRKHQTAGTPLAVGNKPGLSFYKNVNHTGGQPLTNFLPDTPTSSLSLPHRNLLPSVSMGQDLGPVPSTQDLGTVPPQWVVQQIVQQPTTTQADEILHSAADAGPMWSSSQSSRNHDLLPSTPRQASLDSNTSIFPTMQNNSLFDSSATNPVYSPDYNFSQFLDNCLDGSMNHHNDHPPTSTLPDPVDSSWPYLDVERTWNELAHS